MFSVCLQELKIVQPVALRMSPEGLPMQNEGMDRGRAFSGSRLVLGACANFYLSVFPLTLLY